MNFSSPKCDIKINQSDIKISTTGASKRAAL